jgi:3'(2'), 5'-bisphosphate nucleotidase
MTDVTPQLPTLLNILVTANDAIMRIYNANETIVTDKEDGSPLTQADIAAHKIITLGLTKLFPHIPVVSEEGDLAANAKTVRDDTFWLVDPLDGTKEFIKRNGQFTVCIGLIERGVPTFGLLSAPALNEMWYGGPSRGSFKATHEGVQPIHVSAQKTNIVLGSLTHPSPETDAYIADHYPGAHITEVGSQLKFTRIAEGQADVYPRIGAPLKLWDVASGHAVLAGAGGSIVRPDGSALDYNEPSMLIGDFVARAE